MMRRLVLLAIIAATILGDQHATVIAQNPGEDVRKSLFSSLQKFRAEAAQVQAKLGESDSIASRKKLQRFADIEVCGKAVQWIVRHNEFYTKKYVDHAKTSLAIGRNRLEQIEAETAFNILKPGFKTACGYRSEIDGSVQPYILSLPADFDLESRKRWPLYVVLHGRNGKLTEASFIAGQNGNAVPNDQDWVQIDIFGRVNNAYRWGGEVDVFEAMKDAKRRVPIDDKRIVLWGFSMGGAGAWHLGMHHPSEWCAVGAGAGFVDFYKYQKKTEKLPGVQHKLLSIYDTDKYALNLANVPFVTYGGENDKQLLTSKIMYEQADLLGVPLKLIVGPNMGHKFDANSKKEFMAFLAKHAKKGRPAYPGSKSVKFTTYTTKYNKCEWVTVEELFDMYEPAVVDAELDEKTGIVRVTTDNVRALQIGRHAGDRIQIDDSPVMPLASAAEGLLPGVFFVHDGQAWSQLNYDQSRLFEDNSETSKRRDLQGPIDDAFTQPFVCVTGNSTTQPTNIDRWSELTLKRFEYEYDKWMRAKVPMIDVDDVDEGVIASKNLVLFGDPKSNPLIAKVLKDLPVEWTDTTITVNDQSFDTATHGLSMIYPNPLNPAKYVVINSGYTMHTKDFKASNSYLFPKLGDIAVIKFQAPGKELGLLEHEEIVFNELFNSNWDWPSEDE